MLKNNFLFIIGEFMYPFLRENPKLTPKMPEYSKAILTKSYVDYYKRDYCSVFLEADKAFLVLECGFSEYYHDGRYIPEGPKNDIEWCKIEIMDRDVPPDCSEYYVKAEDLEQTEDSTFTF